MNNKQKAYTQLGKILAENRIDENPLLGLGRLMSKFAAKKGARNGAGGRLAQLLSKAKGTAGNAISGALGAKVAQGNKDTKDIDSRLKDLEKKSKTKPDKKDSESRSASLDIFGDN